MKNRQHIFIDHTNYFSAKGLKWKCLFTRLRLARDFCLLAVHYQGKTVIPVFLLKSDQKGIGGKPRFTFRG